MACVETCHGYLRSFDASSATTSGDSMTNPYPTSGAYSAGSAAESSFPPDGYILTNNHVVAGADLLTVKLQDKSTHKASVVGTDPKTELAVIKVDAKNLPVARLGNSDNVRVGDWVLAIGGPFGLENSVTAGIVSAKGRSWVGIADYENFIQTDAAINPGNSGGPMINMRGEVVGINTAIATRSGSNSGVGFAIPSNIVRSVMTALIENGRVERAYLGALIQELSPELAASFGFTGSVGVLVGDVTDNGPAEKAGIQAGDIVTKLNGKPVSGVGELRNAVAANAPGTTVELISSVTGAPRRSASNWNCSTMKRWRVAHPARAFRNRPWDSPFAP